jgi:hypothetical protein
MSSVARLVRPSMALLVNKIKCNLSEKVVTSANCISPDNLDDILPMTDGPLPLVLG